ncbi:MAG: HEPN domain-containing protein [Patescibacteria group bacterium]
MNNVKSQIEYWRLSAERNWKTALGLLKLKHYDACLFFCHLALEKILKGLVAQKTCQAPPFGHNLENFAKLAALELDDQQISNLRTITTFNIAARYDEEKFAFYKICTKEYATKFLKISEDLFLCLKKEYLEN